MEFCPGDSNQILGTLRLVSGVCLQMCFCLRAEEEDEDPSLYWEAAEWPLLG